MELSIVEDSIEELADYNVPDIASKDPEERKLARSIRIQKRVEALQRLERLREEGEDTEEKQPEKPTQLQIQLERSSEVLKQLFLEGEEQVTNLRVANDALAADKREYEMINREKILEALEEESKLAMAMFEEIALKWDHVMSFNDPLNIHEMIQAQKAKFDELIKQKDEAIAMLKMEVRLAETKFNNDQRKQNEDITTLAKRVEKQVSTMRKAHRIELQAIEDIMIQDRKNLSEHNDKRWEELYKKREEQELAISAHKFAQKDQFEEVVTKVRITHMEVVREIKIRLEKDCEALQREFGLIKATALSNREKMDYNYQILKRRELENLVIKSNQKRKLNKLRDYINALKKKIDDYTQKTDNEILKLRSEISGLQKYISTVRMKSKTLSDSNQKRYLAVWNLNNRTAKSILNKLVTIDRLLHEQQLGIPWVQPRVKLLRRSELKSYMEGCSLLETMKGNRLPGKASIDSGRTEGTAETVAYRKALKNVLENISQRSSFLIEEKLRGILEPLETSASNLIKIDNVFTGLGITKQEDVNIMLEFFKPYIRCPICSTRKRIFDDSEESFVTGDSSFTTITTQVLDVPEPNPLYAVHESPEVIEGILMEMVEPVRISEREPSEVKEGECLGPPKVDTKSENEQQDLESEANLLPSMEKCYGNHPIYIEPSYVLRAVKEFVAANYCASDDFNVTTVTAKKVLNISRLMSSKDVKLYWERFKLVLGPQKKGLWDALWYSLQKYHTILEDRHQLNEQLECARKHNIELTHLLSSYETEQQRHPPCAKERSIPMYSESKRFTCKDGRTLK